MCCRAHQRQQDKRHRDVSSSSRRGACDTDPSESFALVGEGQGKGNSQMGAGPLLHVFDVSGLVQEYIKMTKVRTSQNAKDLINYDRFVESSGGGSGNSNSSQA